MSGISVNVDITKGNYVRTQLKIWENLLEMRIKLQKCLLISNQMPQYNIYENFRADAEFMKKTNETKKKLSNLLENMLHLQSFLLRQYPETKNSNTQSGKRKMANQNRETSLNDSTDEEIPSDNEDENMEKSEPESNPEVEADTEVLGENVLRKRFKLAEYEKILHKSHELYTEYRNSVIHRWNEKTRVATGKLNEDVSRTTLKQIDFTLHDKQKLRKRTQLKRSEYSVVGKTENAERNDNGKRVQQYDPEIYDDDDFYHQLLRDLIEYKSADITDPIQLSKQWIQLQNMRNKMKRKINTRATKGRRIRYDVHSKLVNFMAPITVNDTWSEHAKNELRSSLFGKIRPMAKDH